MRLLLSVLVISLSVFSQAFADAPDCEQEEVEQFWDDAIPRVFDAIEVHIRDYRRLGSKYEGYPDLACFTKLYLSHGKPSETELRRRVIRLLEFEVETVYRDLVDNSGDPSTFFFEEFFEEVLCVAQKLGRVRVDNSACDNTMVKAVAIIESIRYEAEKDIRAKEAEKKRNAEKKRKAEEAREEEKQDAYSALGSLVGAIKGKIEGNWSNRLACSGQEVTISVEVNISGEVTGVKVVGDSGDDACRRSAENAVYKASPLPFPDNPRFFKWLDQEFQIIFKPDI